MDTMRVIIFVICTLGFLVFTWRFSIKAKRPHGIARFFAFECILLLVLLNSMIWFEDPLAWNQIVSWLVLILSLFLAIQGFLLLRLIGKPKGDFENTTRLVTSGLYRYIRHPLYASLLWLGTGVFLKNISLETTTLAIINIIALVITAKLEEKEMLAKFGEEYTAYMKKTKMFIPFVL